MNDEVTPATAEKADTEVVASVHADGIAQAVEPLIGASDAEKAAQAIVNALPGLPPQNLPAVHPLLGQTVLYTLPSLPKLDPRSVGQVRPAIVIRVWSDICVQLHVLLDGVNDLDASFSDPRYSAGVLAELAWQTSRNRDESGRPGTWRPRA